MSAVIRLFCKQIVFAAWKDHESEKDNPNYRRKLGFILLFRSMFVLFVIGCFLCMVLNLIPICKAYFNEKTVTHVESLPFDEAVFKDINVCYGITDGNPSTMFNNLLMTISRNESVKTVSPSSNIAALFPLYQHLASTSQGFLYFAMRPDLWEIVNRSSHNAFSAQNLTNHTQSVYPDLALSYYGTVLTGIRLKREIDPDVSISRSFSVCLTVPFSLDTRYTTGINLLLIYPKGDERPVFQVFDMLSFDRQIFNFPTEFSIRTPLVIQTDKSHVIFTRLTQKMTKFVYPNLKRQPCVNVDGLPPQVIGAERTNCREYCLTSKIERHFGCKFSDSTAEVGDQLCNVVEIYHKIAEIVTRDKSNYWQNVPGKLLGMVEEKWTKSFKNHNNVTHNLGNIEKIFLWLDRLYTFNIAGCIKHCSEAKACVEWSTEASVENVILDDPTELVANHSHLEQTIVGIFVSSVVIVEQSLAKPLPDLLADLGGVVAFYFGTCIISLIQMFMLNIESCCLTTEIVEVDALNDDALSEELKLLRQELTRIEGQYSNHNKVT